MQSIEQLKIHLKDCMKLITEIIRECFTVKLKMIFIRMGPVECYL